MQDSRLSGYNLGFVKTLLQLRAFGGSALVFDWVGWAGFFG
jgi:hypothetical protein